MNAADPFGLVGQVLDGQFRVDKLVGEGGFSAVYRGHHQGLNEPIAIKSLKLPASIDPSLVDTFVQRFRDESRILYRLSQGNLHVVRSIAAGTTQSPSTGALVPYMVLEWLEGRSVLNDFTVRRTLGHTGRSLDEIMKLFDTAADGLAYAHAQGVVHRDLNPGNLFLAHTQQGVKMKVLDFGVAKLMHEGALDMGPRHQTVGQIRIFAPAYGAPEQFDDSIGAVGAFSDVYAFALILIEALRDKSINEGTHIGEFAQRACDPKMRPTPRALGIDVSDEVEAAFARATSLDPKERWQSAGDFWQSLRIANKVAIERRHETAARETPPLAMGAPPAGGPTRQPKDVAVGGKNLARTIPLGSTTVGLPRPGAAAPRPRVPTAIGTPPPASDLGAAPPTSTRGPATSSGATAGTTASIVAVGATPPRASPPAATPLAPPRATSRPPSSTRNPALPAMPVVQPLPPLGAMLDDEEEEDVATAVHAPGPEILRTLALHDAETARARAAAGARAAADVHGDPADDANMLEAAARGASNKPPYVDVHEDEPPPSGRTLMMAPAVPAPRQQESSPQHRGPGGLGSTLAMASPLGSGFVPASSAQHPSDPRDWAGPTQASHGTPVQAAPGMHGIGGAHGTPPQGVPAVHVAASPFGPPFGGPPQQQPSQQQPPQQPPPHQHSPQQQPPGPPFGRPSAEHAFPPPSFGPPSAAPKQALPIVPIAIGLAVLALGGIGLGAFALRARHAAATAAAGSAMSSGAAPSASLGPVAEGPASAPAVPPEPVAPVDDATDASPAAAAEPADAAPSVASAAAEPTANTPPTNVAQAAVPAGAPASPVAPAFPASPVASPVAPASPAPSAPVAPSAKPVADPNAFSESVARARLDQANGVLAFCKKEGGVTGPGSAAVTFANDGSVSGVVVDPPYAGTKEGFCASAQFRRAKVPPFAGPAQTVRHSFEVPK